jgi:hypothetical protein
MQQVQVEVGPGQAATFYSRFSPRFVFVSFFASPVMTPLLVWVLIACWIFGLFLIFFEAENAFDLLAASKRRRESAFDAILLLGVARIALRVKT